MEIAAGDGPNFHITNVTNQIDIPQICRDESEGKSPLPPTTLPFRGKGQYSNQHVGIDRYHFNGFNGGFVWWCGGLRRDRPTHPLDTRVDCVLRHNKIHSLICSKGVLSL